MSANARTAKAKPINIGAVVEQLAYVGGQLVWRVGRPGVRAGSVAGCIDGRGYRQITVCGVVYRAHRLVYAIVNGSDPGDMHIDHIDGDFGNNRIENLRLATNAENGWNRTRTNGRNTSGLRNVSFNNRDGKWRGQIRCHGVNIYGPNRSTKEEASADAVSLRSEHYGSFQGDAP